MRKALVLMLFAAATLEAQAPPSFKDGVLAFEKGEWAKAEKAMREAIAGNPNETEGTVSISGSWYETYVPHYFLARALAKQGKCAEALREFAESERQGVTPKIPDFARHLKSRGGCGGPQKTEKPPKVVDTFDVPFADDPTTTTREPNLSKPKADVTPKPKPKDVVVPPPAPPPRDTAAELAARQTRERLSIAVGAYLHGQYAEVLRLLSEPFADRTAAAEAALFRAAARDALFRMGGAADESLRRAIERDLQTYRQLRPNARPDPRIFPPRFIAIVNRAPTPPARTPQ